MPFFGWLRKLGPGLITGAADDDPSGIATYSQVGAQFGLTMLWIMVFSFPLMVAAQLISARIGRVTGHGIAHNMAKSYPRWLVTIVVLLLFVANTINVAADVGAMGQALKLLIGGYAHLYALCFGLVCVLLQIFMPYPRYVPFLKWLTLTLFAYVGTVFIVQVPWADVLYRTFIPTVSWDANYLVALTAVLGTTISPYLFFWQASHEAEEQIAALGDKPLKRAPAQARRQLTDSGIDTYVGMAFSNLIAYFIILSSAVTLHAHGVTDIQSTAQAAEALRPIAGELTFWLFAGGIIGTGLLGVPVLAGSAAYGVGARRARVLLTGVQNPSISLCIASLQEIAIVRTRLLAGGASPLRNRLTWQIPGNREKYRVNLPFSMRRLRLDSSQIRVPRGFRVGAVDVSRLQEQGITGNYQGMSLVLAGSSAGLSYCRCHRCSSCRA